jgi:N6-adenosine-specific RNA methylase IME4
MPDRSLLSVRQPLQRYQAMRAAVEACARVDEAAKIRDQAEALRAYATQRDDKQLASWFDDIKVRAIARIGELCAAVPKAEHGGSRGGSKVRVGGLSKVEALKTAGISKQQAQEAEHVAVIVKERKADNKPLRLKDVRQELKRRRRAAREVELAEATTAAAKSLGTELYGVILADPPWQFQPYSRETGMDRAADNHYPTMTTDELCSMQDRLPAAEDCALFLWATVPMLLDALQVMDAWGFAYRSHFVWVKNQAGTGHWNRNRHELLLVGARGEVPAPAPGEQFDSVITAARTGHSRKPDAVYEMIEAMFPNTPKLEMFARKRRDDWEAHGNQVPGGLILHAA